MRLCYSLAVFTFFCLVQSTVSRPKVKSREFQKRNELKKEYSEEENAGDEFIEGDIYADKHTQKVFESLLGRDALSNPVQRWPNGIVPYKFADSSSELARAAFKEAIDEYRKQTCIRFIPKTVQKDYIYIVSEKGCFSTIGRSGSWQKLSLGPGCERKGTAIHEIMHALGFFHEQSRLDRDEYVTIKWDNIKKGKKFNFQKYSHGQADTLGERYDYGSIMHYPAYAFSSNHKPTILKKKAGPAMGQRKQLSVTDISQINKLYKCTVKNTSPTAQQITTTKPTTRSTTIPTTKPTVKPTTKRPIVKTEAVARCYDSSSQCFYYAYYGYCYYNKYANVMKRYCPRSCGYCR